LGLYLYGDSMLFKDLQVYNKLWNVFNYQGFSLYNYKASEESLIKLETGKDVERLVVSLRGEALVNGVAIGERDIAYIPIGTEALIEVRKGGVLYIAEARAVNRHPFYIKKFSDSVRYDVGRDSYRRRVYVTIDNKDPGDSFIAGYVEGEAGAWTSYPPHRHDEKPEAYIFFGMGAGFGIQILMDEEKEIAYVVRDYDVVLIPKGYHPNVCTSLAGCKYLWIIAAPIGKRDLSVSIHPAFREIDIGRSHLTINHK
jgi:5-deoxy-glucuronate isomerase